jgi:hypothetical protein
MDRMPLSLTTCICWLLDYKSFKNTSEPYDILNHKLQKVMGECIFSVSRDVFTPFRLGLAVQLYHDIGSKQLIETLHSNGFCASYGEVRRYLTSIAHHEIENIQDGVYVPAGIIPMQQVVV